MNHFIMIRLQVMQLFGDCDNSWPQDANTSRLQRGVANMAVLGGHTLCTSASAAIAYEYSILEKLLFRVFHSSVPLFLAMPALYFAKTQFLDL